MPDLLPNFGCPFFNEIALLAYKDASLLKQSLLLYLQKCSKIVLFNPALAS